MKNQKYAPKIPLSDIAIGLSWAGVAIEESEYTIWGAAPIIGEDGAAHLFAARWPENNVDPAWRKSSEIAHYTADTPEGPFTFQSVVVTGSGNEKAWDCWSAHNPEVKRFGNTYALLYISNSDYHQPPHPLNQSIGMRVSESLQGPWRKVGDDGLLLRASSNPTHWTCGMQVVNPAIVCRNKTFHLYFKSRYGQGTAYGLATSDTLDGPYTMAEHPLTGSGITLEDASAFCWNDKVYLLTTDNHGDMTGIPGGGTLWASDDGKTFPPDQARVAYDQLTSYCHGNDSDRIAHIYGGQPKLERPKVLMIDGQPAYIYGPSGWAIHGGSRTACYVLKINYC